MPRPSTDIDAGRAHLLNLVEEMIQQRGAASVNLSELARAAGMSSANLYRFFENKEALYEAVAERWFEPKIRIMEEVVASDLPVREKLYQFYARRFELMMGNWKADPALYESYCELGEEHFETIRGYIDLGDHYLAMIVADAMDAGYFCGLSIDETVSLINLTMNSFCDPKLMVAIAHHLTSEKLARIVNALFDGLAGDTKGIQSKVLPFTSGLAA